MNRRLAVLGALILGAALPAVAASLFLVDSPFDIGGVKQPTRTYLVDTSTGALTLKGDLGNTYTPALGFAAASDTVFYLAASDNTADANGTCFSCLLLRVVLDPLSTTPLSMTDLGRIEVSGSVVDGVSGLTFRDDGLLYADAEGTEGLYVIDPATVFTGPRGPPPGSDPSFRTRHS